MGIGWDSNVFHSLSDSVGDDCESVLDMKPDKVVQVTVRRIEGVDLELRQVLCWRREIGVVWAINGKFVQLNMGRGDLG